jgi:hypothetical protein
MEVAFAPVKIFRNSYELRINRTEMQGETILTLHSP